MRTRARESHSAHDPYANRRRLYAYARTRATVCPCSRSGYRRARVASHGPSFQTSPSSRPPILPAGRRIICGAGCATSFPARAALDCLKVPPPPPPPNATPTPLQQAAQRRFDGGGTGWAALARLPRSVADAWAGDSGGGGAAGAPLWSAWDLWLRLAACVALDVVFRHARPPTCRARSVPGIKHLRHTGTVHPACNPPGPQQPRRLKAASCPGRERGRIAGPGRLLGLLARC